ncbi:unnamed protein product, partial [Symbiodinium sp. KB8]
MQVNCNARSALREAWIFWLVLGSRPDASDAECTSVPLVWKFMEGVPPAKRAVFIVGEYNLPESAAPLQGGPLSEALSCADVAYFPTGCSLADTSNVTGVGNFMAHCSYYPVIREKDTISERVPPSTLETVKERLDRLPDLVEQCQGSTLAVSFKQSIATMTNATFRKTLLKVFYEGLQAINPNWCTSTGQPNLDTYFRRKWGTRKPIFGLEDISVECQAFQGHTVQEDEELAEWMAVHLTPEWAKKVSAIEGGMYEAFKCGNLGKLDELLVELKDLPLASQRHLQYRNDNLNFGIKQAMAANPGKNMLFVIPLSHLVDAANRTGILTLLKQDNIDAIRQHVASGCQDSMWQAPGAAALDHCLKPPAQSQPPSCIQFEKQFGDILGKDVLHGRKVAPGPHCSACVNSSESCSCQMQWSNYDNFVNLCESTQVDGSHGRVYYLDMIRNPGSTREGTALAEKTVAGLYQNCYASSCEIPIIQQMATRNWYKNDPYLDLGSVTVRKLDQPFGEAEAVAAGGLLWWPWLIVAASVALCVLCLVRWFRMPKRNPSMRKSNRWEEEDDISLKGDMAEMQPLKHQAMPPPMAPMPMRATDGSWAMSDKPRIVRDVQDLPTLPTDVDIQMPDMQQFAGSSLPRHQRVISQTRGPAIPAVPQMVPVPSPVPMQQYSLPLQSNNRAAVQLPNVYSGSPTAGTSLQGYQGSIAMPGAQVASGAQVMSVAPVPAGDGSLLALSQQMASQIETSGAEAIRSLRHGQYPAVSVASGSQPSYIPTQTPLSTPLYQPVAQVGVSRIWCTSPIQCNAPE